MGRLRRKPDTFTCLNCDTENPWNYSSRNKYCDNQCQQDHKWRTETKPRILAGNGGDNKTIKRALKEEFGAECVNCGTGEEWNGQPLTLHVDHTDGNSDNSSINNLRLLCPNCHSQTPTWCGRNVETVKETSRNKYIRKYYSENVDKWK